MITVYCRKVFSELEEEAFISLISRVEERRREKILRMKNRKEQLRLLTAGCLLYDALCVSLGLPVGFTSPFSIGYGEKGKPYLLQYPEIYFNLSHSGAYVCLAVGDQPMGVDIQEQTEIREGIAERFFTASDKQKLSECRREERQKLFFRMWSIKESYLKFTGTGISRGLSAFEIDWDKKAIYDLESAAAKAGDRTLPDACFREQEELKGYSLCVCFRHPEEKILWKSWPTEEEMRQKQDNTTKNTTF